MVAPTTTSALWNFPHRLATQDAGGRTLRRDERRGPTMSIRDIGPLQRADEGLNHQIVDTFATIAHSDYSWTEKVWVSIAKADGSIQANLGLGKYPNRGV